MYGPVPTGAVFMFVEPLTSRMTIAGSANTGWVYPLMRTFNVGVNVNF